MEKKNSMVNSLKKQLIAAIAMLLVATIALGSSTYAWFANNRVVTAEGMKIIAQSEGDVSLEISLTADSATGNPSFESGTISVDFTGTEGNERILLPTHIVTADDVTATTFDAVSAVAGNWVHTFSGAYNQVRTNNFSYLAGTLEKVDAVGTGATPVSSDYALVVPVYLRLNPNSTSTITDIKATATISHSKGAGFADEVTGMETAGRVAYIVEGVTVVGNTGYASGEESASLFGITTAGDGGAKTVYVVIYFDGEDESCTSEKYASDEYTVKVTFAGTVETPTPADP